MIRFYLRKHPLLVIVIAQLFATSLWFTVNGVWQALAADFQLSERDLGVLTLSVQLGFIIGTLLLAAALAMAAGLAILLLGDGAYLPKAQAGARIKPGEGLRALKSRHFRAIAGGYFGHCWELYAFWMLVPLLVTQAMQGTALTTAGLTPWLSFLIIGMGAVGCVVGGRLSRHYSSHVVATRALFMSGSLCLIYPFLQWLPGWLLLVLLMFWGCCVIADSPQFSALAASVAPSRHVGSSLAMMNAIGFSLTIPAIWIVSHAWQMQSVWSVLWLLPGPVLGLVAMCQYRSPQAVTA